MNPDFEIVLTHVLLQSFVKVQFLKIHSGHPAFQEPFENVKCEYYPELFSPTAVECASEKYVVNEFS